LHHHGLQQATASTTSNNNNLASSKVLISLDSDTTNTTGRSPSSRFALRVGKFLVKIWANQPTLSMQVKTACNFVASNALLVTNIQITGGI
jgi:hypothetical protein